MDFGIQLDDYIGAEGLDNFAITFLGTLEECRNQEIHDGRTFAVSKKNYRADIVEFKRMIDSRGADYTGNIVKFNPHGVQSGGIEGL